MPLGTFYRSLTWTVVSALGLALVLGSGICGANEFDREPAQTFSTTNLAPLVKRISPAVVGIRAWSLPSEPRIFDPEAGFPGPPAQREWQGAGVIVDALAGFIVTANHLVASASVVKAQLQDGRALDALVLVRSDRDDVALLRVAPDNLHAMPLDYPGALEVGEPVLAIGNLGEWGQSVTLGIVSGLHRSCPGTANGDLIQSDVRVGQGSSGGALVNLQGKLIGIVLAGRSGFAFAAPVAAVRRLFVAAQ